jgi:hypothetical protein
VLSADKTGLLASFLGGLPGHVAARLARAVELDRLMQGKLPHEDILTGLRPVLRRDYYKRTPSPQRLFCLPFQELLSSSPRKTKQKAVIARTSLMPVWNWIGETLLPQQARLFAIDAKALIVSQKNTEALARACEFWALAREAMENALADRKKARIALNDDLIVADAAEMALMMSAAHAVLKIQALMPIPATMTEELLWELRDIYDDLAESMPDVAPYVAVVAMNRLARPWEGLRLPLMIARQHRDTLIAQTDMGLAGEILFSRLDAMQAEIRATRHPNFDADRLLEQVRQFSELSAAVTKEIEVRRDGDWGQRLIKDRVAVGGVMEGFMDRAHKEVAAALPMQRGAGKSADFSRPIDAEKREMAMRYVRLVVGSRNFAAAASFAAKQKDAAEELCFYLRRYNEDVVKEMRGGPNRANAEAQFQFATELTALLFSEEEAELMRRRGKAAQAAA